MAINSMPFANRGEQAAIVFGILGVEISTKIQQSQACLDFL
ncbi:hypothetical protein [Treponema vincentii]|nr:hypothetical protein [Treponema vincentii]